MYYEVGRRFYHNLRHNNNFRLLLLWALVVAHLILNCFVFGIGGREGSSLSETRQRYHNIYAHGRFATDRELMWDNGVLEAIWEWIANNSWRVWFLFLLLAIVYTPIAWRDELGRAWAATTRRLRQDTGGNQDLPPEPPTGGGAGGGGGTTPPQAGIGLGGFIKDFAANLIAEIGVRGVLERRRR